MGPVTMGGEEAHDLLGTHQLEQQCQHQIQCAGDHHAAQCVGQLFLTGHTGELAGVQIGNRLKAAQEGEGRSQERRHFELGAQVEQQRAQTCKQQCGLDGQGQAITGHQNGDQNGGTEHGKQMLQTQHQHARHAQLSGVVDGLLAEILLHVEFLSFSFLL